MGAGDLIKQKIGGIVNAFVNKGKLYLILGIAVAVLIIGIVLFITSVITAIAASSTDDPLQPATGSSWEQFKRSVLIHEGGTRVNADGSKNSNGEYYIVEDDSVGNPTVGHGLCLYSKVDKAYLHKTAFESYGYDSKKMADNWLADNNTINLVKVSDADEIWEDNLKELFDSITSSYSDLNLTEYQCYALTDVKYRRGNTNGFNDDYKNKWSSSDDKYGEDPFSESFSMDSLYSFFNNGWSDTTSGVYTRKKDQWVLFKYGYYNKLKEYWQDSPYTGDFYNDDGSVNEETLESWGREMESYFGLPKASTLVSTSWQNYSVSGYAPTQSARNLSTSSCEAYQCTWWANVRANYYLKSQGKYLIPTGSYGNGINVAGNLKKYFTSGNEPRPNSVFSMTSSNVFGHVAYVEAVDTINGYYYVSHCGSGENWHGISKVKIGQTPCGTLTDAGYIYLDSPKQ